MPFCNSVVPGASPGAQVAERDGGAPRFLRRVAAMKSNLVDIVVSTARPTDDDFDVFVWSSHRSPAG